MPNKPKVSICVPVYNVEPYLAAFLDSALNQIFDDYEIILADNHSTDHSLEILERYEAAFPEKIFVYKTQEHGGPGKGRNLAFQKSRGEYIYWCDADDLLYPRALEKLYAEAVQYDADIVCGYARQVIEEDGEIKHLSVYAQKKTMRVSNETAILSGAEFWLRLIKRSLIEQFGLMQDDIIFDDIRYLVVLHSYAKVIRFLDFPIYYWFKRGSSITSTCRKELCEDSIKAEQYILQNCNPKYLDVVQRYVISRPRWNLVNRWQFFDIFINEIRECSDWFYDNELIKKAEALFDKLRWADSLADIKFPNIVYVNGFGAPPTEERLAELREKVFHDGCEIVILSEKTCDIAQNAYIKQAYDQSEFDFVAGYFALKKIYEDGGLFLHENIRILNYFSYLKYQNAFFALLDKTTYSEWIFGAPAKNEAIDAILKTYSSSWDKKDEYMPLSERISIILTAKYGIHQDGKGRFFGKIVSVLPADMSVADTRFGSVTKKCAFEHDFSAYAREEKYITLPRSALQTLMTPPPRSVLGKSAREKALERELADLKRSNTWKLMMKVRKIGDGPIGPFLKKIFHGLLKIRAKLKRK